MSFYEFLCILFGEGFFITFNTHLCIRAAYQQILLIVGIDRKGSGGGV